MAWMLERMASTTRGVKALLANDRRRVWFGGSDINIMLLNIRSMGAIVSCIGSGIRVAKTDIRSADMRLSRSTSSTS